MAESELERYHQKNKENAIDKFRSTKKMGGHTFSQVYEDRLSKEIEEEYEEFVSLNNSKNIFYAARTPAVLFALIVTCYLISYVVGLIGVTHNSIIGQLWPRHLHTLTNSMVICPLQWGVS